MTTTRYCALYAGALVALIALQGTSAHALSMQECSAKYKAAKEAGTLGGMKWNDFRKAQCGAEATAAPAAGQPTPPPPSSKMAKPTAAPMSAPATTGNAIFPNAVSAKYSNNQQARLECIPASISTMPIKQIMQTAVSNGSKRVVATTVNATNA